MASEGDAASEGAEAAHWMIAACSGHLETDAAAHYARVVFGMHTLSAASEGGAAFLSVHFSAFHDVAFDEGGLDVPIHSTGEGRVLSISTWI